MDRQFASGDIVVGILAAAGVIVLIVVFVWVFRQVMSRDGE
jgi:flagellar biogenesis protein FliO